MMKPRHLLDRLFILSLWIAALIVITILAAIILYLFSKGSSFISLDFILDRPQGSPLGSAGGVMPAIMGTIWLVLLALLAAGFPALFTAIYLNEYGSQRKSSRIMNILLQSMASVPSIITGLFIYALCVVRLGWGISLLAGSMALALMIFPVLVVSIREALRSVDSQTRLAAAALGVSKTYSLRRIILPQAIPGILAAFLLAMGYAAGATAPIMVTAAAIVAPAPQSLFQPVMALPYHLYILFNEHVSMQQAYATALVLLILLLSINDLALYLRSWQERKQAG